MDKGDVYRSLGTVNRCISDGEMWCAEWHPTLQRNGSLDRSDRQILINSQ